MGNIYIVCNSYNPNTAPINRILSFVRGFSELCVEAEVVFLTPNSVRSKVDKHYPLITFKYRIYIFPIALLINLQKNIMVGNLQEV